MIRAWDFTWLQATGTNTCEGLPAPPLYMRSFSGSVMSASQASGNEQKKEQRDLSFHKGSLTCT